MNGIEFSQLDQYLIGHICLYELQGVVRLQVVMSVHERRGEVLVKTFFTSFLTLSCIAMTD